jgi:hypothetical protein
MTGSTRPNMIVVGVDGSEHAERYFLSSARAA